MYIFNNSLNNSLINTLININKGLLVGTLSSCSGILLTYSINKGYNKNYQYYIPAIYGGMVGFYFGYFQKPLFLF